MWCLITSPRERGGNVLESSTCSPSWRRQCYLAGRRCTELLRQGGAAPSLGCGTVCVWMCVSIARGKHKGLWNSVLEMWLERNRGQGARSKEDRRALPAAGEGQVYTGHVCLPVSARDLTQVRSHLAVMAQSFMSLFFFFFNRFGIFICRLCNLPP